MPLVRRTRATLRSAEFGFFGVVVYTRGQTPRRWGEPFNAGVLVFSTLSSRPLRTSWLIVGMGGLDLLPALGRALKSVAVLSCSVVPVLLGPPGPGRQPPSGPRGRACRPPPGPAAVDGPDSVAPPDSAPRSPASTGETPVIRRHGLWSPRRTANGSRPRAPWARLTTIPAAKWPVQTGSPCRSGHMSAPAGAAFHLVPTRDVREPFPTGRTPSGLADSTSPLSVTAGIRQRGSAPVARPDKVAEGRRPRGRRRPTGVRRAHRHPGQLQRGLPADRRRDPRPRGRRSRRRPRVGGLHLRRGEPARLSGRGHRTGRPDERDLPDLQPHAGAHRHDRG